jgi:small subunit ribosomal protein S16
MLTIRLVRTGKKNAPSYRVVLIEKTAPPQSGKFLEVLGHYNPRLKEVGLNKERIEYWLGQGVKASDTVHNLLVNQGIIKGPKIKKRFRLKKKKAKEEKEEETTETQTPEEEAPSEEASLKEKDDKQKEKSVQKEAKKEETKDESKEKAEEVKKEEKDEKDLDKSEKKE